MTPVAICFVIHRYKRHRS